MRKPFLIALGLVVGLLISLPITHADSDEDILAAIERSQSITVADSDGPGCQFPCTSPHSSLSTTTLFTPEVDTYALYVGGGDGAHVEIGAQLQLTPLSDPATQSEINAQFLQVRAYLIDRGLAVQTGP